MSSVGQRAIAVEKLITANHILANEGLFDDGYGHVSVRHPDVPGRFLMSSAVSPATVTAEDILEYDFAAETVDGRDVLGYAERFLHSGIYAVRPDVNCIVHSHSPAVIPFGVVDIPLRSLLHIAHFLAKGAPVFDLSAVEGRPTDALITNPSRGKALAEAFRESPVILMRAHGFTAIGPSVEAAVQRAILTVINAQVQTATIAVAQGKAIAYFTPDEASFFAGRSTGTGAQRTWDMWARKLDRK